MPDGKVLTYGREGRARTPKSTTGRARLPTSAGSTRSSRSAQPPAEGKIPLRARPDLQAAGRGGPAILAAGRPVFCGGTPRRRLFRPPLDLAPLSIIPARAFWAAGPDFPLGEDAGDSFAALLPIGNVLVEAEHEPALRVRQEQNLTSTGLHGDGLMLVLPSGEILLGGRFVYRAAGAVNPAWAPAIASAPSQVTRGSTYPIAGTQFNGLSQANAFGDEYETNTNYPLVRITNTASGHVIYARTHDHSSMGVATGAASVSTNFDVPAAAETGPSTLVVVANGIASTSVISSPFPASSASRPAKRWPPRLPTAACGSISPPTPPT